jgi:hypothetical protein
MKRLIRPLVLILSLALIGCAGLDRRDIIASALTPYDIEQIVRTIKDHSYLRARGTSWTNPQTGNQYTVFPRWHDRDHHIFELHAVVGGYSVDDRGKLLQAYGHAYQSANGIHWTVDSNFSDINAWRY